jgi:hypothetical protein
MRSLLRTLVHLCPCPYERPCSQKDLCSQRECPQSSTDHNFGQVWMAVCFLDLDKIAIIEAVHFRVMGGMGPDSNRFFGSNN